MAHPARRQLLLLPILAALLAAFGTAEESAHPKRDQLTPEEKEKGYQVGPDGWVRPPTSKWRLANKRMPDKRSIHCPICLTLVAKLYKHTSSLANQTGTVSTSWRMKNGKRDFKKTDPMKSDAVIGEAMEELCNSEHLPELVPGVEETQLSLVEGQYQVKGIKLSHGHHRFLWPEAGKKEVEMTRLNYFNICEDLVQEEERRLIDAMKQSNTLNDMLRFTCSEAQLGACSDAEMEAAMKEPTELELEENQVDDDEEYSKREKKIDVQKMFGQHAEELMKKGGGTKRLSMEDINPGANKNKKKKKKKKAKKKRKKTELRRLRGMP